jgi:HNH endonuclease
MTVRTLRRRLLSRITIDPSGCLIWNGETDPDGYGRIYVDQGNRHARVHRVMFEMFSGPIPDGLHIDHRCRVRLCANVAHMELVTNRQNVLRGTGPTAINAGKEKCDAGHDFDLFNTYIRTDGHRRCRQCTRERRRKIAS